MVLDCNGIIGRSSSLQRVFAMLAKVSPTDSTVLVSGESGTGKELLVRALHFNSRRRDKPFIPVNCGAIPRDLIESELFGHEKGAFTHAIRSRAGRFEVADGGTIFLDEIGELDLPLQVKILRVIQEKEFERVGSTSTNRVDVRIIAATNRDLENEVAQGRFREDLFYRLNVIPIHLPPLRERNGDILLLVDHFLRIFCEQKQRPILRMSPDSKELLLAYPWPGNVRELENFMERISILCENREVLPEDLPEKILHVVGLQPPQVQTTSPPGGFCWPRLNDLHGRNQGLKDFMDEIEERLLHEALETSGGVKNQAAELLGIKRTTLIEKLKKRNIPL
ncbi:MAG TPA: sigma-54-dependent Fis family transcriptional regulator [Desulfonatronum sp.]|nr:sigma-54-dependent Fis family transcriptional regulator [Desulfonatronum sp.]